MATGANIGLFGASFNPAHNGHLAALRRALDSGRFDEVWLVPVGRHPFDKDLAPFSDRTAMARLLQKASGSAKVSVCEIENAAGLVPSYTYDTVHALCERHPNRRFTLILGSDAAAGLSQWHRIDELRQLCGFYFVPRKGYEDSNLPEVSSSQVRARLAAGQEVGDLVPPSIAQFLTAQGLYRKSSS